VGQSRRPSQGHKQGLKQGHGELGGARVRGAHAAGGGGGGDPQPDGSGEAEETGLEGRRNEDAGGGALYRRLREYAAGAVVVPTTRKVVPPVVGGQPLDAMTDDLALHVARYEGEWGRLRLRPRPRVGLVV
jgi:hypothetical protein